MTDQHSDDRRIFSFIRRLMPNATEAELLEATKTFEEYMRLVWEISEHYRPDDSLEDR